MKREDQLKLTSGTTIDSELMVIVDRNDLVNPNEAEILPND